MRPGRRLAELLAGHGALGVLRDWAPDAVDPEVLIERMNAAAEDLAALVAVDALEARRDRLDERERDLAALDRDVDGRA